MSANKISTKVVKRNGNVVEFDENHIFDAILKAFKSVYPDKSASYTKEHTEEVTKSVVNAISGMKKAKIKVEEIQDIVESKLMGSEPKVAKAYILYRHKHAQVRLFKSSLGIEDDDLKMPLNSLIVLAARYLLKNEDGSLKETPKQLFTRVAKAVASAEKNYGKSDEEVEKIEREFYEDMTHFNFMPNSPTLFNAGTPLGQLSACFVLPIDDSMGGIFDSLKNTALIHQSGGGTGFSFSRIRPENDFVKSTGGVASGPISFMKIFDAATQEIKQGGKRRGANMGILRIDHPDILNFIVAKENEGVLRNFNISVAITDDFMRTLQSGSDYNLINPRTQKVMGKLNSNAVWNLIVTMAWKTGDPGLVFIDRMNSTYSNPVPKYGPIESTNPCGEQPLYPYDSCNLGSINLANMVRREDGKREIDWSKLKHTIQLGTRFLDDVIDANKYPIPEIDRVSRAIRRIGLGVMGWADMLIELGIRYDSNEALILAENVMGFITETARKASEDLAKEKGEFPEFKNSIWYKLGYPPLRNSTVTTIAPTGTISIISGGVSQGIEPIFSVVYMRNVHESLGSDLIEVNNEFENYSIEEGFYSDELMKKIAGKNSIQEVEEIPESIRKIFVTAYDVPPEWHVKMQAAFQKHTDNAVSKTINFPSYATPQDIEKAYLLSYKLGCKGITVYRDKSKSVQVLELVNQQSSKQSSLAESRAKHTAGTSHEVSLDEVKRSAVNYQISGDKETLCPECGTPMIASEGCYTCPNCGYSKCE
ncbi:adenosylcobalamin-dependent ribonucleoside-diphosphate reductase [Candidatus Mancarchaeum acidiphilum]|uniref:Vitamin B12-dependent ribonucleotide reductase n=1 Tax=Candidatus Mancarchaeum acidiphilum TaxID=1920749 RepID=A0A218NN42_9ARCH|nr:adenosylcobalamin-dependent ribonucleoside-diphosphate reductase [Candidatus Mancarchaeum acidiphilum]ASI13877.1 adenosylcobalamin-dependent ribonucleoside-diphosphate reductase [Candidatus Mancarchaeum acidiphilum]